MDSRTKRFLTPLALLAVLIGGSAANAANDLGGNADELAKEAKRSVDGLDYVHATEKFKKALNIADVSYGKNDTRTAAIAFDLGICLLRLDQYGTAEQAIQRSLGTREARLSPNDTAIAETLEALADVRCVHARYEDALLLRERALRIREAHPNAKSELGVSLCGLAQVYMHMRNYAAAESTLNRSLALLEGAAPDSVRLSCTLFELANLKQLKGEFVTAESLYKQSQTIRETKLGPQHPMVADSLKCLSGAYAALGKMDESVAAATKCVRIAEAKMPPDSVEKAGCLRALARAYHSVGRDREAEGLVQRSLEIDRKKLPSDNHLIADDLEGLAVIYGSTDRFDAAEPLLLKALRIYETAFGTDSAEVTRECENLATVYFHLSKLDSAEAMERRALAVQEKLHGPNDIAVARALDRLALIHHASGELNNAGLEMIRSYEIKSAKLGIYNEDVAMTLESLADVLQSAGRTTEASRLYDSVTKIRKKIASQHRESDRNATK